MFLRRLGMNVTRIRTFRNHWRVYYDANVGLARGRDRGGDLVGFPEDRRVDVWAFWNSTPAAGTNSAR